MTTNATLVHKHIDFLVENEFKLLISLDGNEVNHSYRVFNNNKNSHKTVIKNIDIIKRNIQIILQKMLTSMLFCKTEIR